MKSARNTEGLTQRAINVFPGPHSNLRGIPSTNPFFVKGKDAHVWDSTGKEYIDFMMGVGPGILGYSHKKYIDTLKNQLSTLYFNASGASRTPWEVRLGEKIARLIPCAEKVRFGLSGTEAVQLSIRLARAFTGKPCILRFEGLYHGWLDNVAGGKVRENPLEDPTPLISNDDPMFTEGRDPNVFKSVYRLPWNDIEILKAVVEKFHDKIAMILTETHNTASGCLPPRPGYLEKMRELCTRYNIVLCFDEVFTGFRIGLGGGQAEVGVTPDLATFGKALAAGLPMAAVAGRADILDLLLEKRVVGAGTFNGYVMGVVAALTTLQILEADDGRVYKIVDMLQSKLENGFKEICTRRGVPILLTGFRGYFATHFTEAKEAFSIRDLADVDKHGQERWRELMVEEGIWPMWGPKWVISSALTSQDLDKTLELADKAMGRLY